MEKSKELVKQAGIIPDLRLFVQIKDENGKPKGTQATGPHRVKILSDKVIKSTEYETGKEIPAVEYIMEEDGEKKRYEVPVKDKRGDLHYLIQHLSEIPEGEEIILEGKKKGPRSYVAVTRISGTQEVEEDPFEKLPQENIKIEVPEDEPRIDPKDLPF